MNLEQLGRVASGGTVLDMAVSAEGHLWLASPAGLFRGDDNGWQAQPIPLARVGAVAAADRSIWVAGIEGGLLRSHSGGKGWSRCLVEQTDVPIIALAPSPNYARDGVVLAGTAGAGVLRSTNGGKHFELVNFGLDRFTIFDLAVAAPWRDRRAYCYAAAGDAVFWSPNGGRGWCRAELDGELRPVAVAVSPTENAVYAGCDGGELLISADNGRTFTLAADHFEAITSLAFDASGALLVGTIAGIERLNRPDDILYFEHETLCLLSTQTALYAGTTGNLLKSADNGSTWHPDQSLAARRIIWFAAPAPNRWYAAGPDDGVFISTDQGRTWRANWTTDQLLSLACNQHQLWVGTPEGVSFSANQGESWRSIADVAHATALLNTPDALWVGDSQARVWRNNKLIETPFTDSDLLGLYGDGQSVVAAVWRADAGVMQLWVTVDEGLHWRRIFVESAERIIPQLGEGLVGIGRKLYRQTQAGWQLFDTPSPIVAIVRHNDQLLIIQAEQIATFDGDTLNSTPIDLGGQRLASGAISGNSLILCSTVGTIWRVAP